MWSGIDEDDQNLFAVFGKNLSDGKVVSHRSHRKVEAASTIKLLILVYLLKQAQEDSIVLDSRLQVKLEDLTAGGSGMLQSWMPQRPVEISQLCLSMMGASDNVAANTLLRSLGMQEINAFAQQIGLADTELLMSPIDPSKRRRDKFCLGVTTAADMGDLLTQLLRGELLNPTHTQYALGTLEAVQQSYITRGIDTRRLQMWGSKTGTLYQRLNRVVLNECGFVVSQKDDRVVLCVFSNQPNTGLLPRSQDAPPRLKMVQVMAALYEALY